MRLISLPILTLGLLVLSGCTAVLPNTATSTPATTANWFIHIQDPGPGGVPPLFSFAGAITRQDNTLTATLRALSPATCVATTFDIQFTGSVDAQGNYSLSSANLPGNVVNLSNNGGLTISGNGPCAFPNGVTALLWTQYPPFTGPYTVTLTSTTGATATLTATASVGTANADGQFPETGTFTLVSPSCSTTFSFAGIATGTTLTGSLSSASGGSGSFTAQLSTNTTTPVTHLALTAAGTACANGSYASSS